MHKVPPVQVVVDLCHKLVQLGIVLDGYGQPELAVNLSGCGLTRWGGHGCCWSLELDVDVAAVGKCVVGGAGLTGVGELEIMIVASSGTGDGDACLIRAPPMASPISGNAALGPLVP